MAWDGGAHCADFDIISVIEQLARKPVDTRRVSVVWAVNDDRHRLESIRHSTLIASTICGVGGTNDAKLPL